MSELLVFDNEAPQSLMWGRPGNAPIGSPILNAIAASLAEASNQIPKSSHLMRYGRLALYGYHRIPPTLITAVPRRVLPHLSHMTTESPALPSSIGSEI